jgi:Kdo2-lipid IVA lauroyltransferase/acyltransferase
MHPALTWLSRRPLRLLHAVGGCVGWLPYVFSASYRKRLQNNAALAGLTASQRRASVAEAGRMVLELPRLWLRPPGQPIEDPLNWDNAELVDALLAQGRGLILLTPHVGSFEVAGQAYAQRFGAHKPLTALYRPARQPWLRELEEQARARPGLLTAPANLAGVRQLIRALRRGETLGMLPDQVPPDGQGVWAPFFGQPAYTMTLVARLLQQTDAAVCLIWVQRRPQGGGYGVHLRPLPQPLPARPQPASDEAEKAWLLESTTVLNQAMEWVILQLPTQYLWGYHRYKQPRQGAGA